MPCDLLKATTFKALSVVNYLKVLMPPSVRFSMYLSFFFFFFFFFLEMVEGHQSIDMLNAHLVSLKAQMR